MGPGLTIDLNLLRGDPPGSIKYIGNQSQLNLIIATVIFLFTAFTNHLEVSAMNCETADFPDLTGSIQKKDFFILI